MQYDPTKVDFNHSNNIYPSINQPQYGAGNINQSYQTPSQPPPYTPYPHQQIYGAGYVVPDMHYNRQIPLYPQQNVVIVSTYASFWRGPISTTFSPKLRAFFLVSGLLSLIWSFAVIALEIIIIIESYWTLYRGIWAGGFLLSGSICMLIAAGRTSYPLGHLIKVFALTLVFSTFGLVSSAISYNSSVECSSHFSSPYSCDNQLVHTSKMISLIIFAIADVHTLINVFVLYNTYKKTLSRTTITNH